MGELMNMFRKKSWVRFYSLEPAVADLFPVITAHSLKRSFLDPERKKAQSKCPVSGLLSSANCPGITNIAHSGYILTAPADFTITTTTADASFAWEVPYQFDFCGHKSYIDKHDARQTYPLLNNSETTLHEIVKVETPWRFKASDDIVLLQLPVTYNNESRFTPATGILDPKYGHVLNVQLFWHALNAETFVKAGTPLVQYIPMSRHFLNTNHIETIVDGAGEVEQKMEQAFQYANKCNSLRHDTVQSRINRVTEIFKRYRKNGVRL